MKKVTDEIIKGIPVMVAIGSALAGGMVAMEDAFALRWIAQDKRRMRKFRIWLRKELGK